MLILCYDERFKLFIISIFQLIFWIAVTSTSVASPTQDGDYGVGLEQLVSMSKNQNISVLQQFGGVAIHQHIFVCDVI